MRHSSKMIRAWSEARWPSSLPGMGSRWKPGVLVSTIKAQMPRWRAELAEVATIGGLEIAAHSREDGSHLDRPVAG